MNAIDLIALLAIGVAILFLGAGLFLAYGIIMDVFLTFWDNLFDKILKRRR